MARKERIKPARSTTTSQLDSKLIANKILIAEDDEDTAFTYKEALEDEGYDVKVVSDGEDCAKAYLEEFQKLRILKSRDPNSVLTHLNQPFDAVILDYKMPKMNGMQVAKEIFAVNPHQRIIFASAYTRDTLKESVRELDQVVELLQKPFSYNLLIDTLSDKEVYRRLKKHKINVKALKNAELSHEQLTEILNIIQNAGEDSNEAQPKRGGHLK